MKPAYSIVPTTPEHLAALAESMRSNDRLECTCAGFSALDALRRSYTQSVISRVGIIGGQVGAIWGCGGSALGGIGEPWLLTSAAVERIPISFMKVARYETANMLSIFPRLEGHVLASYTRACRFLEILGFRLDDPIALSENGVLFHRYWAES